MNSINHLTEISINFSFVERWSFIRSGIVEIGFQRQWNWSNFGQNFQKAKSCNTSYIFMSVFVGPVYDKLDFMIYIIIFLNIYHQISKSSSFLGNAL